MKMIDALYPGSIPAGTTCDIIAAYIDHNANPQSFTQAVARFPNAVHLKITVTGDPAADAIDGESGTGITPTDAAAWARTKRAAGQPFIIYCNENLTDGWGWAAYKGAVAAIGIDPGTVHWWTADYDNVAALRPGEWARQYWDLDQNQRNTYDTSITATSWPPNSPTLEDPLTPQELQQIVSQTAAASAKAVWAHLMTGYGPDGKPDTAAHPADFILGRILIQTAITPAQVAKAVIAALPKGTAGPLTEADVEAAVKTAVQAILAQAAHA